MTETIEAFLRKHTGLSDTEIALVSSLAISRKLRRNEPLLTAGQVCRHKTFVVKGLLRTYSVSDDGQEPILQFSPEGTWTLDAESYDQQLPSHYNIAAVEPSEVLLWHRADFQRFLAQFPGMKIYAEGLISRNIYSSRHRLLTALSATPEEKYTEFATSSPDLLRRVPLRMIAAYLGISLKTLTRIRHAQWAR